MLLQAASRVAVRAAPRFASGSRSMASPLAQQTRTLMVRSTPRLGHNLEDHYDIAEYVTKMQGPFPEYVVGGLMVVAVSVVLLPFLHSNYYFTGRFLPKDQGNTQLCDNSW